MKFFYFTFFDPFDDSEDDNEWPMYGIELVRSSHGDIREGIRAGQARD